MQAEDAQEPAEADVQKEWEQKDQWYARAVSYWDQQVLFLVSVSVFLSQELVLAGVMLRDPATKSLLAPLQCLSWHCTDPSQSLHAVLACLNLL